MKIKLCRFRKYLAEIQRLKAQVSELQGEIGELYDHAEAMAHQWTYYLKVKRGME
jgi:uncharacterized protein (UPF0335 family)